MLITSCRVVSKLLLFALAQPITHSLLLFGIAMFDLSHGIVVLLQCHTKVKILAATILILRQQTITTMARVTTMQL